MDEDIERILAKARRRLGERVELDVYPGDMFSREYKLFRNEAMSKRLTRYEHWCNGAENILKIGVKEEERDKITSAIKRCHLDMNADGAMSFAVLVGLLVVIFGFAWGLMSFVLDILAGEGIGFAGLFLPLMIVLFGVFIIKPLSRYPLRLANSWRLKASNQMVLCILYIVMYMRHTSNLEHAIKFAGEHIGAPLSLDLRKIMWDVETGKHVTLKESLDEYLYGWRNSNLEFVEAFHLIESSLYERSDQRRIDLLEKSLQVMLEGTYEKMLHYAHDLKSPITMLHMLGVILPILGLVIFPLLGSFMGGLIKWWHLAILYNLLLPFTVYYIGSNLLSKRPTGYSESEVLTEFEKRKYIEKGKYKIDPLFFSFLIIVLFCFLGLLPLILVYTNPGMDFNFLGGKFLDYKSGVGGPYGVGALLMSLLIPLGFALGLSFYYRQHTKDLIKYKRETNKLEKEFSGALFQLGNRVGEGIPVEIAFSKVSDSMRGTPSGSFLRLVSVNIRKMGMSVKSAIFDKDRGAILAFPSALIESSMKVLVEAAKKGPKIVAKSLITISNYVHEIHRVNERLKDLLADIVSSMKSQISFLTPMIAGIVVAVSSMIVTIINKLSEQFASVGSAEGVEGFGAGGITGLMTILNIKDVIPSFYFQLIVGIYLIEIVIILTILSNGIEKGVDKITERYNLSRNLLVSMILYVVLAFIGIIVFNFLAAGISVASGSF